MSQGSRRGSMETPRAGEDPRAGQLRLLAMNGHQLWDSDVQMTRVQLLRERNHDLEVWEAADVSTGNVDLVRYDRLRGLVEVLTLWDRLQLCRMELEASLLSANLLAEEV